MTNIHFLAVLLVQYLQDHVSAACAATASVSAAFAATTSLSASFAATASHSAAAASVVYNAAAHRHFVISIFLVIL